MTVTPASIDWTAGTIRNAATRIVKASWARKKARRVDLEKCNSCGDCWENCPRIPYPSKLIVAVEGTTIKAKALEEKEKIRAAAGE